jgi:peptide/nickel transport system ATP-binding protein
VAPPSAAARIAVDSLTVDYLAGSHRATRALDDVSVAFEHGRRVAIVGESGSGKSTLGLALLGLLPASAKLEGGRIAVGETDVTICSAAQLRALRGRSVAMIFQDAKTALDPLRTIGYQIAEPLRAHRMMGRAEAADRARELLGDCEIAQPAAVARQYPHELSGGMRQRAMIASALSAGPSFLVADEPTSALDVTTQAAILDLLRGLSDSGATATILITHDLAVVASFADDVVVLYAGVVVESGPREAVMGAPAHPYTAMLLASVPSLEGPRLARMPSIPGSLPNLQAEIKGCRFEPRCPVGRGNERCRSERPVPQTTAGAVAVACHFPASFTPEQAAAEAVASSAHPLRPLLAGGPSADRDGGDGDAVALCRGVEKTFTRRSLASGTTVVRALRGIDLEVRPGETLAMVGESGSGKTTLARILVGLEYPDRGEVFFEGRTVTVKRRAGARRRHLLPPGAAQMVFQDPSDSLNPFHSLREIISEPLTVTRGGRPSRYTDRVRELLAAVGLDPDWWSRRPSQLSGGQRQRVAIARALASEPKLIVADEAVSSLDVSARGQILNLLADLQAEHGFACIHVSHDLSLVRHLCERVVVMYAGRIVEQAPVETLFAAPRHPYTRALIAAVPTLAGPKPAASRSADRSERQPAAEGCPYHRACPWAQDICRREDPAPIDVGPQHLSACHFARELDRDEPGDAVAVGDGVA